METGTVCVVCKHENPPGVTECVKCSAPLQVSDTAILSGQVTQEVDHEVRTYQGRLKPGTVSLHFIGKEKPLVYQVKDDIILGRYDGTYVPNLVDLTRYRGDLLGVSRRHAAIRASKDGYTIEDLSSTNGTWLNDNELEPAIPYPLANGDNVRLGELIVYIYFKPVRSAQSAQSAR